MASHCTELEYNTDHVTRYLMYVPGMGYRIFRAGSQHRVEMLQSPTRKGLKTLPALATSTQAQGRKSKTLCETQAESTSR